MASRGRIRLSVDPRRPDGAPRQVAHAAADTVDPASDRAKASAAQVIMPRTIDNAAAIEKFA
jgi:hypothetical protein